MRRPRARPIFFIGRRGLLDAGAAGIPGAGGGTKGEGLSGDGVAGGGVVGEESTGGVFRSDKLGTVGAGLIGGGKT